MSFNIVSTYRFEKELKRLIKKYPSLNQILLPKFPKIQRLESSTVYLHSIYDKSEKADLKPKEVNEMIENLELG